MKKIVLATSSPYRKEIFRFLGIEFEAEDSKVDESQLDRNNPEELVKELSKLKAEAVAKNHPDAIVIGFDSVGYFDGKILEKSKSKEESFSRLKAMSGNNCQYYTGVYMIDTILQKTISKVVITNIYLRDISDGEINFYLNQDEKYNTYALGYDTLKHYSCTFTKKIEGSHNNLIAGMPLETIIEMLKEIGYKLEL